MTDTTKPNGDRRHAWARPSRSEVSGRVSRGAMMRRRSSSSSSSVEARESAGENVGGSQDYLRAGRRHRELDRQTNLVLQT
jgi:hypothetical protein